MTETFTELSEDEFDALYPLVPNHLNPSAGWAPGEGRGCLFETYGEELEFVRRQDPRTIWTMLDGDDGDLYLASGYHLVNRIGYLVSTVAVPESVSIEVHNPTEREDASQPEGGTTCPPNQTMTSWTASSMAARSRPISRSPQS